MFSGTLSPNLLADSPSLVALLLDFNRMSGSLSENLFALNAKWSTNWSILAQHTESRRTVSELGVLGNRTNKSVSLEFLSGSGNAFSGTLPCALCRLSLLNGLSLNSLKLSGSLPSCLGHLSKLHVLAAARNNILGSVPAAYNYMTNLSTLFLFRFVEHNSVSAALTICACYSNRLLCEAPSLDNASNLGLGPFLGLTYPASVKVR